MLINFELLSLLLGINPKEINQRFTERVRRRKFMSALFLMVKSWEKSVQTSGKWLNEFVISICLGHHPALNGYAGKSSEDVGKCSWFNVKSQSSCGGCTTPSTEECKIILLRT